MLKRCCVLTVLLGGVIAIMPVSAQQARKSPHETISGVFGGNRVTITYGRPYTKDPKSDKMRTIWGGLVPYGKAWRTGADEATILTTQQPLMIGETEVPAGAYTLYTVPEENGGKLVFSKNLGAWGIPVNEKNDLTRVELKKKKTDKQVDQFTIALEQAPGGGVIKMSWENAEYSVEFKTGKAKK